MKCSFLIPLLSLASLAYAQEIELPHEFEPGTPARAAEVNDNFGVLADAVNANAAAVGELLSAGGPVEIGTFSIAASPYSEQQIPIVGIQWSGTVEGGGGGGGAVLPAFGGFTVIKPFDLLSPQLLADFAAVRSLPEVRIDLSLPNSMLVTVGLGSVHISGLGASPHQDGTPLEAVEFAYEKISLSTTDPATNTTATACFDIAANTAC